MQTINSGHQQYSASTHHHLIQAVDQGATGATTESILKITCGAAAHVAAVQHWPQLAKGVRAGCQSCHWQSTLAVTARLLMWQKRASWPHMSCHHHSPVRQTLSTELSKCCACWRPCNSSRQEVPAAAMSPLWACSRLCPTRRLTAQHLFVCYRAVLQWLRGACCTSQPMLAHAFQSSIT